MLCAYLHFLTDILIRFVLVLEMTLLYKAFSSRSLWG